MSINGKTYYLPDANPSLGSAWEYLSLTSLDPERDATGLESFQMRDYFVNYENSDLMSVMSLDIYSYEAPLITSVDIGQELDWQDLGDPNAGGLAYFNLATLVDGGVTGARALIDVKGFHIGVKKNVDVPEPAPIILLAFGLFVIRLRRGKNTKAKGVEVILFLQTYLINLKSVRLRETLALIGLETK